MPVIRGLGALPGKAQRAMSTTVRLPAEVVGLIGEAQALVGRLAALLDRVDRQLDQVSSITADAAASVRQADDAVRVADELLAAYRPMLHTLAPVAEEVSRLATKQHAAAVFAGLDVLPQVTGMVVPAVRNLVELIPELDLVIERLDNVGKIVQGLPGAQRFLRRGEARAAEPSESMPSGAV